MVATGLRAPRGGVGATTARRWGTASGRICLDVKITATTKEQRRTHGNDHLHADRRGPDAGHVLLPPRGAGLRLLGRCRRRDPRHLPGRPHPGPLPRAPHRGAADQRRPRRARRPGHHARGQHHQAAERLGLDAAAQGRHQGAAEPGLRAARLPRRPADRRGARDRHALRQGQGQRGQPGAARGQLRPARPLGREELRPQAPALDGRLEPRQQDQRRDDGRRRLPRQRAVGRARRRRHPHHPPRGHRRHHHRAQGRPAGARGRGRRRHRAARGRARRVPARTRSPAPRPTTCCSPCTSRPR